MNLRGFLKRGSLLTILTATMLGVALACSGDDATNTPPPAATATATTAPTATAVPEPTATLLPGVPTPTATAIPTATSTAVPEPTPGEGVADLASGIQG